MRVGIVGAGALGLVFASMLSKEHEVVLVCKRKEQAKAIKLDAVTSPKQAGKVGFFILTVKAYDAQKALKKIRRSHPKTPVVAIQNGLLHFEDPHVIRGVTTYAATREGDCKAVLSAAGELFLERKRSAKKVSEALNDAGVNSRVVKGLGSLLWEKFFINVGINALGATTGKRNGEILQDERLVERMKRLVGEAVVVSEVDEDPESVFHRVVEVAIQTGENRNSMLQDLKAGRKTEIDFLNGAVCHMGAIVGLDTPENERITREVKKRGG